jgi:hypothetical protein
MAYKRIAGSESVIDLDTGGSIPADLANIDYQTFLAWCKEGNVPEAADPLPVPVPPEIDGLPADVRARIEGFRAMTPMDLVTYVDKTAVDFDSLKGIAKDLALALSLVAGRVHLREQLPTASPVSPI